MLPYLSLAMILSIGGSVIEQLLEHAYYPSLLLIFVIASLGVPIPEDVPLIAAGVLLNTHPHIATSWLATFVVSLIGVMSGDMILYSLGRRWGDDVFSHRWVRRLITPARMSLMSKYFHRYGSWMVFFGRFFVGIRAMMCLTAGVTRFPFSRFVAADLSGAAITIPFFVGLGYMFADVIPRLRAVLGGVQLALLIVAVLIVGGICLYVIHGKWNRKLQRMTEEAPEETPARTPNDRPAKKTPTPASHDAPRTTSSISAEHH